MLVHLRAVAAMARQLATIMGSAFAAAMPPAGQNRPGAAQPNPLR
jgi:hypothetical protein